MILQRASAGSGKTYALTRQYLRFLLLSARQKDLDPQLAGEREIQDNLKRILAITFTNKATKEMKERIVDNLSKLAEAANPDLTPEKLKKIDYLEYFCKELNVNPQVIGETASTALSLLLNHYSDFKVSTIDSFFQEILRIFAYESNLNENYKIEIDSKFITKLAIDATLNEIDSKGDDKDLVYWLSGLMGEKAKTATKWNVFGKSSSKNSLYSIINNSFTVLDKENFKIIKEELDNYFQDPNNNLRNNFEDFRKAALKERTDKLAEIKTTAESLKSKLEFNNCYDDKIIYKDVITTLEKLLALPTDTLEYKNSLNSSQFLKNDTIFKPKKMIGGLENINDEFKDYYKEVEQWKNRVSTPLFSYYQIFSELINYVGVMQKVLENIHTFLGFNNIIKLSDTNSILKKIIGDSDAPFVFERLGSRINHFLIDEFQDTSRMQWEIMKPLIDEIEGRREENLIIGDAKQSIYRFRSADPSLITSDVPNSFFYITTLGDSEKDNTNWRSLKNVVEFNNYFFYCFSRIVENLSKLQGGKLDFKDLYSNVVQKPNKDSRGYIEIKIIDQPADKEGEAEAQNINRESFDNEDKPIDTKVVESVIDTILSLIERGYRQKDIAVLVRKTSEGDKIIDAIVEYNATAPQEKKIEFVSEESLRIANSEAVGVLISIIEKMASTSILNPLNPSEDANKPFVNKVKWKKFSDSFKLFSMKHRDLPLTEQLKAFFSQKKPDNLLGKMLAEMQTTALPAIVEASVETFLTPSLRESQAPFIAGFQDLVLDYCDIYPSDPASFLEWWKSKGSLSSISSPEGINAVNIMTIHKSKGLEFKCVIVPLDTLSLEPSNNVDWNWVKIPESLKKFNLPPYLPLKPNKKLLHTPYQYLYIKNYDETVMDNLNLAYVAFTRACCELYAIGRKKRGNHISSILLEVCSPDYKVPEEKNISHKYLADQELFKKNEDGTITYGEKNIPENDSEENESLQIIRRYDSPGSLSLLHFKDEEQAVGLMEDEEDPDPRSEGNLLHAVMQRVKFKDDLKKAFLQLRMKGFIDLAHIKEWEPMLEAAMEEKEPSEWFSDKWEVISERSFWCRQGEPKRPDRIMINPQRTKCIIIDYKFGSEEPIKKYTNQVGEYMRLVKYALKVPEVEGYVWFPKNRKVVKVSEP